MIVWEFRVFKPLNGFKQVYTGEYWYDRMPTRAAALWLKRNILVPRGIAFECVKVEVEEVEPRAVRPPIEVKRSRAGGRWNYAQHSSPKSVG